MADSVEGVRKALTYLETRSPQAAAAAPRGVYVCGNTSSTAGLTVSIVRDAVRAPSPKP